MENDTKKNLNNTILANAKRDKDKGVRFARVLTGAENCAFCFALASRGAVYHTRESAGSNHRYHRGCDCKIVPGYENNQRATLVEGHNTEEMYQRYLKVQDSLNLPERWKNMSDSERSKYGGKQSKFYEQETLKALELKDTQWLYDGTIPEPSYESEEVREFKFKNKQSTNQHKRELKTSRRIAPFGFDLTFVVDEITIGGKRVGLADLKSGLEIKTLEEASSYNTIDNHLRDTSRKNNAKAVIFDNSECDLDDNVLIEWIERSRRFKRGSIYIYDHDGNITKIR